MGFFPIEDQLDEALATISQLRSTLAGKEESLDCAVKGWTASSAQQLELLTEIAALKTENEALKKRVNDLEMFRVDMVKAVDAMMSPKSARMWYRRSKRGDYITMMRGNKWIGTLPLGAISDSDLVIDDAD